MDTAPDYSGTDVKPRIIECFDGNDIPLNEEVTMKMDDFPWMRELKGKRLMVTDGTTLLGADDKAGITCIMEALVYLKEHPEVKHGQISVAFTPDEEIGNGPKYFDVKRFDADFAYTMDGGTVRELAMKHSTRPVRGSDVQGFSIHPGSAKNRMINAALRGYGICGSCCRTYGSGAYRRQRRIHPSARHERRLRKRRLNISSVTMTARSWKPKKELMRKRRIISIPVRHEGTASRHSGIPTAI